MFSPARRPAPHSWNLTSLRSRALGLLAKRDYGRLELQMRLTEKDGAPHELAKTVVNELVDRNLIHDERYARELERIYKRRGYGPLKIRLMLSKRHLHYIPSEDDHDEQIRTIHTLIHKKVALLPSSLPKEKQREKVYRYLLARGFHTSQIMPLLDATI